MLLQAFTNPSPDFKTIEECNHMLSIPLNSILQISINVHLFSPYMILKIKHQTSNAIIAQWQNHSFCLVKNACFCYCNRNFDSCTRGGGAIICMRRSKDLLCAKKIVCQFFCRQTKCNNMRTCSSNGSLRGKT